MRGLSCIFQCIFIINSIICFLVCICFDCDVMILRWQFHWGVSALRFVIVACRPTYPFFNHRRSSFSGRRLPAVEHLAHNVSSAPSLTVFRKHLKIHLFNRSFPSQFPVVPAQLLRHFGYFYLLTTYQHCMFTLSISGADPTRGMTRPMSTYVCDHPHWCNSCRSRDHNKAWRHELTSVARAWPFAATDHRRVCFALRRRKSELTRHAGPPTAPRPLLDRPASFRTPAVGRPDAGQINTMEALGPEACSGFKSTPNRQKRLEAWSVGWDLFWRCGQWRPIVGGGGAAALSVSWFGLLPR